MTESKIRSLLNGEDAGNAESPAGDAATQLRPLTGPIDLSQIDLALIEGRREVREGLTRFLMPYKFAIDEVMTKLNILQEEFSQTGEYNPIEHVSSRLKDPDSIIDKMQRRGVPLETDQVRSTITDIAGVRVVCSFMSDVYRVFELLTAHSDITVYQVKDYIESPKPNGYRSLHLLLEVPVYLSSGPVQTIVEVQIRTIAMDFWASLEHKIYYKYQSSESAVPRHLLQGLSDAAEQARQLDSTMEGLHVAIRGEQPGGAPSTKPIPVVGEADVAGGYGNEAGADAGAYPASSPESDSDGAIRRIA